MTAADFRIESNQPLTGRLWAGREARQVLVHDRSLAVALAAKSQTRPEGAEVRVVHVPTGEVLFRKPASRPSAALEDGPN